jgi:hypothetical protein
MQHTVCCITRCSVCTLHGISCLCCSTALRPRSIPIDSRQFALLTIYLLKYIVITAVSALIISRDYMSALMISRDYMHCYVATCSCLSAPSCLRPSSSSLVVILPLPSLSNSPKASSKLVSPSVESNRGVV